MKLFDFKHTASAKKDFILSVQCSWELWKLPDYQLEVNGDTLISELKHRLEELSGIPEHDQTLMFKGKALRDDSTLSSSGIRSPSSSRATSPRLKMVFSPVLPQSAFTTSGATGAALAAEVKKILNTNSPGFGATPPSSSSNPLTSGVPPVPEFDAPRNSSYVSLHELATAIELGAAQQRQSPPMQRSMVSSSKTLSGATGETLANEIRQAMMKR